MHKKTVVALVLLGFAAVFGLTSFAVPAYAVEIDLTPLTDMIPS
jgi:hypothetical protein